MREVLGVNDYYLRYNRECLCSDLTRSGVRVKRYPLQKMEYEALTNKQAVMPSGESGLMEKM